MTQKPKSLIKKLPSYENNYTLNVFYSTPQDETFDKIGYKEQLTTNNLNTRVDYESDYDDWSAHSSISYYTDKEGMTIIYSPEVLGWFLDNEMLKKILVQEEERTIAILKELALIKDIILLAKNFLDELPTFSVRRKPIMELINILISVASYSDLFTSASEYGESEQIVYEAIDLVLNNENNNNNN